MAASLLRKHETEPRRRSSGGDFFLAATVSRTWERMNPDDADDAYGPAVAR
jgi:hypothetical protein